MVTMAQIDDERGRANEALDRLGEANRSGDFAMALIWAGRLDCSRIVIEVYLRAWWAQGCREVGEVERLQAALASEEAEVRSLAERGMARGAELDEARTKLSALSVVNETLRAELRSVRPSREAARRATVDEARLAWAASVRGDGEEAVPAQVLAAARDALSDLADMTPAGEVQALLARALAALDGPA